MFLHPTLDAIGHSAVENVRSTGDDINVVVVLSFAHLKTQWAVKRGNRMLLHCTMLPAHGTPTQAG